MSLPHASTEDVTIAGHVIPKDTIVMGHLKSAHMDPAHFPQPEKFRPERFIDDITGKITNKDRLIPFSIGNEKGIFIGFFVHLVFSSTELKAQVSFSDRPLSVRLSVNFFIFDFFSRTTGLILTRLGINHP
jgi:hypothetical protein